MLHLLKIEWLKVKNYRTFWILAILYLLSIWGANYIAYIIQLKIYKDQQTGDMANMFLGGPPYAFPKVWAMTSYVSSYLLFIAGLIIIVLVTNEFSFKTHRQNIIDGLTRTQFIVTKLVLGFIIALASTIVVLLTATMFGMVNDNSFSVENMQYVFYFFLNALSYCWLAILISLIFKRSGISIGFFFLYTLIIENVLVAIINYYFKSGGNLLPIQSSDELLPLPFLEKMQREISPTETNIILQLSFTIAYLIIYFIVSKRKFETADL